MDWHPWQGERTALHLILPFPLNQGMSEQSWGRVLYSTSIAKDAKTWWSALVHACTGLSQQVDHFNLQAASSLGLFFFFVDVLNWIELKLTKQGLFPFFT